MILEPFPTVYPDPLRTKTVRNGSFVNCRFGNHRAEAAVLMKSLSVRSRKESDKAAGKRRPSAAVRDQHAT